MAFPNSSSEILLSYLNSYGELSGSEIPEYPPRESW